MISPIKHTIKKLLVTCLKCLIYVLFVTRVFFLWIKKIIASYVKVFHSWIVRPKTFLDKEAASKALFTWSVASSMSRNRMYVVTAGFTLIFLIISVRLIVVASSEYINYRKTASGLAIHRKDITDRNNNLLAVNLPGASLYANPRRVLDPEDALKKLLTVIPDLDQKKTLKKLKSTKSFAWIKRDVAPQEHEKLYNLGLPGFGFEREQRRIYMYGNLLSHVIGYVGRDLNGLAGLEKHFDKFLVGQGNHNAPSGDSLKLSIDVRVQDILSDEIGKMVKKFSAKGASGVVVNPNNGEIIALVSNPDFDPHYPGKAKPNQLFNMATQGVYELGSGTKALTIAIGMDSGSTSIHDVYDLTYMKVGRKQLADTHPVKGWYSVPYIFLNSSNIGVAQIVLEIGKKTLSDYFRKLGMLDRLKIELPERARPLFPAFSRWTDLSIITMSYGYAISVSPLHYVQAMLPVVNGGMHYPLTLVRRDPSEPLVGKRVFKKETSDAMRKMLRLGVTVGTGKKAEVKGYYVGGKTGTANIAVAGKYDKSKRLSAFFGVIPASNPQYMIYIVFNEPQGIKETWGWSGGGWTGAPAVGAVLKRMVALFGMEKPDENSSEVQELNNVEYKIQDEA